VTGGEIIALCGLLINVGGIMLIIGMYKQRFSTLIDDMEWIKNKLSNGLTTDVAIIKQQLQDLRDRHESVH